MPRTSMLRSRKSCQSSARKSVPTAATILTGAKKRAASAKKLAEPPSASVTPPCVVSTVSYPMEPTTTMLMCGIAASFQQDAQSYVFRDQKLKGFARGRRNRRTVGDDTVLERVAASASRLRIGERERQIGNGLLRLFDVRAHHAQDLPDIDGADALMPAVVVRDQAQRGVAELGFTGESRFLHRGHADDVDTPRAIEIRFGAGRELRAFDTQIDAAVVDSRARRPTRLDQVTAEIGADRIGERDMADDPVAEEGRTSLVGVIDEVIDRDQIARRDMFLHAAGGADRNQAIDAKLLHPVDIRPIV